MFIVDFIVLSYYILLRRAKQNQLQASIYGASALPLTFVSSTLIFWFVGQVLGITLHPFSVGLVIILLAVLIDRFLLNYYTSRLSELNDLCEKYDMYRLLFILPLAFYLIISIALFLYSLRFV